VYRRKNVGDRYIHGKVIIIKWILWKILNKLSIGSDVNDIGNVSDFRRRNYLNSLKRLLSIRHLWPVLLRLCMCTHAREPYKIKSFQQLPKGPFFSRMTTFLRHRSEIERKKEKEGNTNEYKNFKYWSRVQPRILVKSRNLATPSRSAQSNIHRQFRGNFVCFILYSKVK